MPYGNPQMRPSSTLLLWKKPISPPVINNSCVYFWARASKRSGKRDSGAGWWDMWSSHHSVGASRTPYFLLCAPSCCRNVQPARKSVTEFSCGLRDVLCLKVFLKRVAAVFGLGVAIDPQLSFLNLFGKYFAALCDLSPYGVFMPQ